MAKMSDFLLDKRRKMNCKKKFFTFVNSLMLSINVLSCDDFLPL